MLIAAICGSCEAVADIDPEWEHHCAACGSDDLDVFEGARSELHHTRVRTIKASGPGALDGHEARCSCGWSATTSLSQSEANRMCQDHIDYVQRKRGSVHEAGPTTRSIADTPHDPYAPARNFTFEDHEPGVGARRIRCTAPGCKWSLDLTNEWRANNRHRDPVAEWVEHAQEKSGLPVGWPQRRQGLASLHGAKRKVLHTHMGDVELGGSDKSHRYLLVHDNSGKYPTVESGSHTLEGVTKQRSMWPSHHRDHLHIYDAETHQKVGELGEPTRKDCPRCGTASYYPNADYCPQCGYKGPHHDRLQREDYERRRQINSVLHEALGPGKTEGWTERDRALARDMIQHKIRYHEQEADEIARRSPDTYHRSVDWSRHVNDASKWRNHLKEINSALHTAGPVVIPDNVGARSFDPPSLVQQIGKMNILSISGGRIIPITNAGRTVGLSLPVSNGYAVNIFLANDDTYTVQRVFRGRVKGEQTNVYAEDVGEAAYQAGMFQSNDFGGHVVGSLHEAGESRACELGNHSDCTSSSCSCPHHNRGGRNKAYMSGACAEGDHAACKMSHGTGPNDCQCRRSSHKTGSKLEEITAGILETNPGMNREAAVNLAQKTIERFPRVGN